MRHRLGLLILAALILPLAKAAADDDDHVAEAGDIRVVHAWTRATDGPDGEVFMDIGSRGAGDRLIGAESEAAAKVEIHGGRLQDGAMTSAPLEAIEIPAGGEFVLEPGVVFLKLSGLREPLVQGEELPLVLTFEHAGRLAVEAKVEAADATQHSHAGHAH